MKSLKLFSFSSKFNLQMYTSTGLQSTIYTLQGLNKRSTIYHILVPTCLPTTITLLAKSTFTYQPPENTFQRQIKHLRNLEHFLKLVANDRQTDRAAIEA